MGNKILFVVHRYYPYPGGSEYYVHWMAQESEKRGWDVTVLTDSHKGDVGNIKVTSDKKILKEKFDGIIIHGCDCTMQKFVHMQNIPNKIYMMILPSDSQFANHGLKTSRYVAYSTHQDLQHLRQKKISDQKIVHIRHGISLDNIGEPGFKDKYNIKTSRMFMIAGGFYPHKQINQVCKIFKEVDLDDVTLCAFGYAKQQMAPKPSKNLKVFYGLNKEEVNNALYESDLYIMNSNKEGFGLVLLEAALNNTEWVSRPVGGAPMIQKTGNIFYSEKDLKKFIKSFKPNKVKQTEAKKFVVNNHMISHVVDDIETIVQKGKLHD